MKNVLCLIFALIMTATTSKAQDGSSLWFTNLKPSEKAFCPDYVFCSQNDETLNLAKSEINSFFNAMFGKTLKSINSRKKNEGVLNFTVGPFEDLLWDGFAIRVDFENNNINIISNSSVGCLYGAYALIRMYVCGNIPDGKEYISNPSFERRILNHWDNPEGTVERGYAGRSIFFKDGKVDMRADINTYARANASVGINGVVVNNVNAHSSVLSSEFLSGVKTIADKLRPYGIKVYLSINFSSPAVLGGLKTSDPLDTKVKEWWQSKVDEIYGFIPDFGGFLVKANSEGLPGPMDFGRTHADGANMLADVLAKHNGIVMWRAFVYNPKGSDRAKQAYEEFVPLDGKFRENVIVQVKNGPIDFQPREPISPLFGAMKQTKLMPELQITQEYLGFSTHICFLAPLFKEFLETRKICGDKNYAIAGVANIGCDTNWCGNIFAQSNWYAFGRMAWNEDISSEQIANEWICQTFTKDEKFVSPVKDMMLKSREAVVNYMTPLGLHHLMGWDNHFGPQPWCVIEGARPDWLPSYYHKADDYGIGFDRSSSGSNAVAQYNESLKNVYNNATLCPPEYLLWFHHLPWTYRLQNGNTLWNELCFRYSLGLETVKQFKKQWMNLQGLISFSNHAQIYAKLERQVKEAQLWRDGCLLYFQQFSKMPLPEGVEPFYYKSVEQCEQLRIEWGKNWKVAN